MADIIPFPETVRQQAKAETRALLGLFCSRLEYMWRDGWAQLGGQDEVIVLWRQQVLGVWRHCPPFLFVPEMPGVGLMHAATFEEAYWVSFELLGDLELNRLAM